MLQTLGATLSGGDEASAQEALEAFVELAESDARFVRKHLGEVAAAMLTIAESEARPAPQCCILRCNARCK